MEQIEKKTEEEIRREEAVLEELDDEIRRKVEAVKENERLKIQNVEDDNSIIIITAGEKEFKILTGGEEQGEELARESLEDGELWKNAVSCGYTTSGLDDWIDGILSIDGWENEIGGYDGRCRYATTTKGEEVVYYRSN